MEAEFKKGDIVTFKSYHKAIDAKVLEAKFQQRYPSNDFQWVYRLEGISEPLTSQTTGRSIVESRDYVESDGEA